MLKKALIVVALVVVVFGVYQIFDTDKASDGKVTVAFTGIDTSCDGCQVHVKGALSKIIGVKSMHINPAKDLVRVTFNSKVMKADWIAHSLKSAGFKADDIDVLHG